MKERTSFDNSEGVSQTAREERGEQARGEGARESLCSTLPRVQFVE